MLAAVEDFALFRKQLLGLTDKRLLERVAVLEHFVVTVLDDSCFVKVCVPEWRALYRRLVPGKLLTGEWKKTSAGSEEFVQVAAPLARKLLARFAADRICRESFLLTAGEAGATSRACFGAWPEARPSPAERATDQNRGFVGSSERGPDSGPLPCGAPAHDGLCRGLRCLGG